MGVAGGCSTVPSTMSNFLRFGCSAARSSALRRSSRRFSPSGVVLTIAVLPRPLGGAETATWVTGRAEQRLLRRQQLIHGGVIPIRNICLHGSGQMTQVIVFGNYAPYRADKFLN